HGRGVLVVNVDIATRIGVAFNQRGRIGGVDRVTAVLTGDGLITPTITAGTAPIDRREVGRIERDAGGADVIPDVVAVLSEVLLDGFGDLLVHVDFCQHVVGAGVVAGQQL